MKILYNTPVHLRHSVRMLQTLSFVDFSYDAIKVNLWQYRYHSVFDYLLEI